MQEEPNDIREQYIAALKGYNWLYWWAIDPEYWELEYWKLLLLMQKIPVEDASALWTQYAHKECGFPTLAYYDEELQYNKPGKISFEEHQQREWASKVRLKEKIRGRTDFVLSEMIKYCDVFPEKEIKLAKEELEIRRKAKIDNIKGWLFLGTIGAAFLGLKAWGAI